MDELGGGKPGLKLERANSTAVARADGIWYLQYLCDELQFVAAPVRRRVDTNVSSPCLDTSWHHT